MKKLFSTFILSLAVFGVAMAQAGDAKTTAPSPAATEVAVDGAEITFDSKTVDYGTIDKGSNKFREFSFTNTGNKPLIITRCKGSCGCTVPTCPQEPIPAGGKGTMKVSYDTKRVGAFTKTITVTSNAKTPSMVVKIKGTVKNTAPSPANGGTPAKGGEDAGAGTK